MTGASTTRATTERSGSAAVRVFDREGTEVHDGVAEGTPADVLASAIGNAGFVWAHFENPNADDLSPWAEVLNLHPLAVDEATTGDQQPTVQGFGEQVFIVLWATDPAAIERRGPVPKLFLFVGDGFVLSVVRDAGAELLELERRFAEEQRYLGEGPAGALYIVLAALVQHFTGVVTAIEAELADLEREVFDEAVVDDSARIYRLRQRVGRIERPLSSFVHSLSRTPDSLTRLIDRHPKLAPYLTDAIDDLMGLGDVVGDQRVSLDSVVASHENNVAQQQNSDMRRISAYGALLAVPTVIAGLYGMNFKNIPGVDWSYGWLAVAAAFVVIDVIIFIAFKRRHWL